MSTTTLIIIIVVAVVVIVLLAIYFATRRRQQQRSEEQRERTREEFGSEYERAAQERGSEEEAERELRERRGHVERQVEPLSEESRQRRVRLERAQDEGRRASLTAHEPLVDHAVLADGLAQLFRGLLFRAPFRKPARASDDIGADMPGLPVVVGDIRVHHGEAALGLLLALGGVGDEVALL